MKTLLLLILVAVLPCITIAQAPSTPQPLVPTNAQQPVECQVYLYCDDLGELFINGVSALKATDYERVFDAKLPLKRGDIITASVTDKQGGPGGFWAILILKNNIPLAASKDFRYTTAPKPDWRTNSSLDGFRQPQLSPLKNFALGTAKNPQRAWSQPSDRHFATLHFKYVIP